MKQGSALRNCDQMSWLQTTSPEALWFGRVGARQEIPRGSNVRGVPPSVSVLLLPSTSWMVCAWQNTTLPEQLLVNPSDLGDGCENPLEEPVVPRAPNEGMSLVVATSSWNQAACCKTWGLSLPTMKDETQRAFSLVRATLGRRGFCLVVNAGVPGRYERVLWSLGMGRAESSALS